MAEGDSGPYVPPNADTSLRNRVQDELATGCGNRLAFGLALGVMGLAILALAAYLILATVFGGDGDDAGSPASPEATSAAGTNVPVSTAAGSPTATDPTVNERPATSAPAREPLVVDATLVPREGTWVITNQPSTVTCAGVSVPLPEEQQSGTITLIDNGAAILASGFDPATADLLLARTEAAPNRVVYTGEISGESLGASAVDAAGVSLAFTMVFSSPDELAASTTGSFNAGGFTCTIERPAAGSPAGEPASAPIGGVGTVVEEPYVVCADSTATPEQVEIDDPVVASTPAAALVAFLDGPGPHPVIDDDLVQLLGPDGTLYYAMQNETGALTVVIEVEMISDGFAVTRWSSSRDC